MSDLFVDLVANNYTDFRSENLDVVGYDRQTKTLYVEFQSSGYVYSYPKVEESTYEALIGADSLGSFYAKYIKPNFPGGEKFDDNHYIVLREDETTGEESSFDDLVETANLLEDVFGSHGEKSRYSVSWEDTKGNYIGGQPEYQAVDELDALRQFNVAIEHAKSLNLLGDVEVKVKAVTHHFD